MGDGIHHDAVDRAGALGGDLALATSAATSAGSRASGPSVPTPPGVCTLTTSPGAIWNVILDGSSRSAGVSGFSTYRAGRAAPPPKSPHGA
ncbi:MAG TPA: hypothetical protein VNQ54_10280 [Methylomirabilota bacterium]|nr:hypothetical protein [Methylomirabilota bacterium]